MEQQTSPDRLITAGFILVFLIIAAQSAWISDDAGLTLRTIDNFLNGYGPTWNVAERVQAFTHPLWMLLLSAFAAVTQEYGFTTIVVSLACSLGALLILSRGIATSLVGAVTALTAVTLSKAFVDYSTSGLENPLAHLLLALFIVLYLRRPTTPRAVAGLSFTAGLIIINRQDHLLLVAPALLMVAGDLLLSEWQANRSTRRRITAILFAPRLLAMAAGALPLALWHGFSLIYYGFPFPNTAYAKLNTGIEQAELARQGFVYLMNSLKNDPLTLLTILAGLSLPFARRNWWPAALGIGIAIYLGYIIRIGGDFMSGRFLSASLLVAAALIAHQLPNAPRFYAATIVVALIGLTNPLNPLVANSKAEEAGKFTADGIMDERLYYFPNTGLINLKRNQSFSQSTQFLNVSKPASTHVVAVLEAVGMVGLNTGPDVHIIDVFALGDPLLARLPAAYTPNWRVGHFRRSLPTGYVETLESGINQISDPNLAAYYDQLSLVLRGDLFDPSRWAAIWALNSGAADQLINRTTYRYPNALQITAGEFQSPEERTLPITGALVDLGEPRHERRLEVELGYQDRYRLLALRGGNVVYDQELPKAYDPFQAITVYRLELPADLAESGYDSLRVIPVTAIEPQIGRLRLLGENDFATSRITLGGGWAVSTAGPYRTLSPANLFVDVPAPQPYIFEFTPTALFDPETQAMDASSGLLEVRAGPTFSTTLEIAPGAPVGVQFHLPAGRHTISLNLLESNGEPIDTDLQLGAGQYHLRLEQVAIRGVERFVLPENILIDGQEQRAEPARHLVVPGAGWYPYEPDDGVRWSSSPSQLRIYSPDGKPAALKLEIPFIFNGSGLGDRGELQVQVNGDEAGQVELWSWQPAVIEVPLREGWNTVRLELAAGSFRPSDLDGTSTDNRNLSFAVRTLELVTRP